MHFNIEAKHIGMMLDCENNQNKKQLKIKFQIVF